jgi:hypothetical protein
LQGDGQEVLEVAPLSLHLREILSNVRTALELLTQLLCALTQCVRRLLEVLLVLVVLGLIRERLERAALRDELLIPALQYPLRSDASRDLITDGAQELISARDHVRRNASEEGELFCGLLENCRNTGCLDIAKDRGHGHEATRAHLVSATHGTSL